LWANRCRSNSIATQQVELFVAELLPRQSHERIVRLQCARRPLPCVTHERRPRKALNFSASTSASRDASLQGDGWFRFPMGLAPSSGQRHQRIARRLAYAQRLWARTPHAASTCTSSAS
jgi:hypothetical protein